MHGLARNDLECIRIALKIAKRLAFQDMALDFLKDTVALPSSVRLVWFCCGAVAACAVWWMKPSIGTRVAFGHRMPFSKTCLSTFYEIRSTQIETELSGIT